MLVERDAVLHAGTITAPHESRRWLPLASQPRALIESRATGRQSVQKNAGRPAPWRLIFHCPHVFSPQTTMVAVHVELDF